MSFLDTEPAAIDPMDFAGPWGRFKVSDPRKRMATLRELCRGDAPVTLGAPNGPTVTASLWAVDDVQGRLHLNVSHGAEVAHELVGRPDLWGAAYLLDAKVQFSLPRIVVDGPVAQRTIYADAPRDMYHLPRRRAVRVRRAAEEAPVVHFSHPLAPDTLTSWLVLDLSLTGCALWKRTDSLPTPPGTVLRQVELDLDAQTTLVADLRVQHSTQLRNHGSQTGVRVGCAWQGLSETAHETLQRWIRGGRRRRELVSLSFD